KESEMSRRAHLQSQRDCVLQPRVASLRATLGTRRGIVNPNGVVSYLSLLLIAWLSLSSSAHAEKSYTLGMVAKSQGNPFFEAARAGANDAARELSAKHGVKIRI